ncbi:hypothetical protein [Nocardioides sp.]|uniref:hypothetical protein n=1 Tax=Nocardioides sp. TaxID=35761 RepID=UPI00262365E1|nr:hypothetical protein [Nocardioides sp.]
MTIDTRLADLAPDVARSADRTARLRDTVLTRAVADHDVRRPATPHPRRRWLVAGAVAATCAGVFVVGPTLVPHTDSFAVNALTPLAQAAARTTVPPLSGGRVYHRITSERQTSQVTGEVSAWRTEEWTRGDGTLYRRITVNGKVAPTELWTPGTGDRLTPAEIAALPTDPAALIQALGETRQSERVSVRDAAEELLAEVIYGGYAPTGVWVAAIEAYGSFDDVHVRVDAKQRLTYVTDIEKGGPLTMVFDSATGQLRGYDSVSPEDGGFTATMRVSLSRVEEALPEGVAEHAQPNGPEEG